MAKKAVYVITDLETGKAEVHTTLSGLCLAKNLKEGSVRAGLSRGWGVYFDKKRKVVISRAVLYKNPKISGNLDNLS